jgi:hypothetical protein
VSSRPQAFSTLALIYLVTNAKVGSGLRRRPVQRVMTRPEREAVTAVLERLPATVSAWSGGLAALEPMHIVEVRRPLTSLSSSGPNRWWAGPRDCREELVDHALEPRYDSVLALWPSIPDLPLCGWGCTVGPSEATLGAGFSSIASDHWPTLATDPDPEQGYVHEWLHQVEATYRVLGLGEDALPGLHDAAAFTSIRPAAEAPFGMSYAAHHDGTAEQPATRTWAPWYRDWMTGRLRRIAVDPAGTADSAPFGLTPDRWSLRGR